MEVWATFDKVGRLVEVFTSRALAARFVHVGTAITYRKIRVIDEARYGIVESVAYEQAHRRT